MEIGLAVPLTMTQIGAANRLHGKLLQWQKFGDKYAHHFLWNSSQVSEGSGLPDGEMIRSAQHDNRDMTDSLPVTLSAAKGLVRSWSRSYLQMSSPVAGYRLRAGSPSFGATRGNAGHTVPPDCVHKGPPHHTLPVLATCGIRRPEVVCENPLSCPLLLADCTEEEYHLKHCLAHLHRGGMDKVYRILTFITRLIRFCLRSLNDHFVAWTKPNTTSLLLLTLTDQARSKSELVAENALLRVPLNILRRQVKRPACTRKDRLLLARIVRNWKQALIIVQPETLLRGPRQGFKLYWKYTSRAASSQPKLSVETVALIKEMARDNRLWGAERIRGELLKLGIHVCKRTIQKYMRQVYTTRPRGGQNWAFFLRNHAKDVWACDFLPVTDLFFRSLFAFFIIELKSRKVIHVGVARSPTDAWTAQQRRFATAYGKGPKYLIRDRDGKFGPSFARVAATSSIQILKTPSHGPRANAICERFLGSVRREYLDHLFILHERQLDRVLHTYVQYFNRARPHQGIRQQIPGHSGEPVPLDHLRGKILSLPVLGGLHHDYRRSA
jgi:putative transposase